MIALTSRSFLKHIAALGLVWAMPATLAFGSDPLFRGSRVQSSWALWSAFQQNSYRNGRVFIHDTDERQRRPVTTSRAQAYAMFFSLVADDRPLFDSLWKWTNTNLCSTGQGFRLAARRWGELPNTKEVSRSSVAVKHRRLQESGSDLSPVEGVLNSENDSHADLWMAYALLEASRLWNEPYYHQRALELLSLLKQQCVRVVGTLGPVILPSSHGFVLKDGTTVLDPGLYPLQILSRFALEDPYWETVRQSCMRVILRASPGGVAPDLVKVSPLGFRYSRSGHLGNRRAVLTYLWAGMLSSDAPERTRLLNHFQTIAQFVQVRKVPPGAVDAQELSIAQTGSDAFGAAFIAWYPDSPTAAVFRTYLQARSLQTLSFDETMLVLFGLGFDRGIFAFDRQGRLVFPVLPGVRK